MSSLTVPPILATLIGRIGAAVPARARTTFLELLIGAAATKGGHVTDALLAIGLPRAWTTYYWSWNTAAGPGCKFGKCCPAC